MSIVGLLGGIEGKQTIKDVLKSGIYPGVSLRFKEPMICNPYLVNEIYVENVDEGTPISSVAYTIMDLASDSESSMFDSIGISINGEKITITKENASDYIVPSESLDGTDFNGRPFVINQNGSVIAFPKEGPYVIMSAVNAEYNSLNMGTNTIQGSIFYEKASNETDSQPVQS